MVAYDGNGLRQWTNVDVDEDGRHKVVGKETRVHAQPATKYEGGPAFPVADLSASNGMSLRDWFAGQALAQLARNISGEVTTWRQDEIVMSAYELADAMLAARGQ